MLVPDSDDRLAVDQTRLDARLAVPPGEDPAAEAPEGAIPLPLLYSRGRTPAEQAEVADGERPTRLLGLARRAEW
jgi:hypothetical protein